MKGLLWLPLLMLTYASVSTATGWKPSFTDKIIISNQQAFSRSQEVISIDRKLLRSSDKNLFPIVRKNDKILTTQLIDEDDDEVWDKLLIEINLAPLSSDTLSLSWVSEKDAPKFKVYTGVRLSLRSKTGTPNPEIRTKVRQRGFVQNISDPFYQMEGPGIENDKVAFRAFFDIRNGKDIYGKITEEPVLDQVGLTTWHKMQSWGMDILKTGNSLGAGALAVKEGSNIYRLADADTSVFNYLYQGPLQAAFKLAFTNWDVGSSKRNGSETISMTKGNFFYKNEIEVPLNKLQELVSGIAHFTNDSITFKKHNSVFSSISSYGTQAEGTNTKLGLAIMFSTDDYVENKITTSSDAIPNTAYVVLKPSKKTLYFFACWQKTDKRFENKEGFESYLQQTAERLAYPVQIKIIHSKI